MDKSARAKEDQGRATGIKSLAKPCKQKLMAQGCPLAHREHANRNQS